MKSDNLKITILIMIKSNQSYLASTFFNLIQISLRKLENKIP